MTTGSRWSRVASRESTPAVATRDSQLATRPNGFTLIEMLTVILIMAVFASVAVPSYSRFESNARFQKTVQDTAGVLAWARDAAIQYSSDATVQFDPQTDTLTATVQAPAADTDVPSTLQDAQDQQAQPDPRTMSLGENAMIVDFARDAATANGQAAPGAAVSQNGQQNGITFHEDGSSDGGGFTVVSSDGHSAVVRIAPPTGHVTVGQDALQ